MAWLARSIANSLNLDDDEGEEVKPKSESLNHDGSPSPSPSSPTTPSRGVKEDLSELTKTLSRQFWGVASFLAPPPQAEQEKSEPDGNSVSGIRNDFAEIGGKFRTGISKLSDNINVSEITKMASNFLQLGSDDEDEDVVGKGAVGVTEEVVGFARDIAMHPETWLDFPLPENDDDEDFDLSDAQQEHALAVEHLAPRLAALRMELCPGHMSENSFWKIYFVLLHPRLSKEHALLLSTPQVLEARAMLTQELKKRPERKLEDFSSEGSLHPKEGTVAQHEEILSVPSTAHSENEPLNESTLKSVTPPAATDSEAEKHPVESNEIEIVDKSVIIEDVGQPENRSLHKDSSKAFEEKDEDDGDDWLNEENSEIVSGRRANIPIDNDEDVSFSDLEDDEGDVPASSKKVNYNSDKDSRDWVELRKSSSDSSKDADVKHFGNENVQGRNSDSKESSDWLDVDDIDVA